MNRVHPEDLDILVEYDFSNAVRGKYANRFPEGSNLVVLDPDVAAMFTDSESVNRTLRAVGRIIKSQTRQRRSPASRKAASPSSNQR